MDQIHQKKIDLVNEKLANAKWARDNMWARIQQEEANPSENYSKVGGYTELYNRYSRLYDILLGELESLTQLNP